MGPTSYFLLHLQQEFPLQLLTRTETNSETKPISSINSSFTYNTKLHSHLPASPFQSQTQVHPKQSLSARHRGAQLRRSRHTLLSREPFNQNNPFGMPFLSFFKCCVGGDPRPSPESIRPVGGNPGRRGTAVGGSSLLPDNIALNKKLKMPTEVFFDPSKPDGQLSSVTDPPTSAREYPDPTGKKRRDPTRDPRNSAHYKTEKTSDMEAPDNNGLTRGQNFMKVEKWLRSACVHNQVDIHPGTITNLEDIPVQVPEANLDPPTEKDRLPPSNLALQPLTNASHPR